MILFNHKKLYTLQQIGCTLSNRIVVHFQTEYSTTINAVTFKPDDEYLLIQSESYSNWNSRSGSSLSEVRTYVYNDHKDLIMTKSTDVPTTYVYDAQGNWISKKNGHDGSSTSTRVIEYW
jgi:YD repeat-containing protein